MEALLIGLRIMALLTLARWLTPSTTTLSSWAKGLSTLTLAYTPIHALVFWLLQEPGGRGDVPDWRHRGQHHRLRDRAGREAAGGGNTIGEAG